MKKILAGLATGLMMFLTAGAASAVIVDFNSNLDNNYWDTPIISNGFTFFDITGQGSFGTASNLDGWSANNGTVHLMDWTNSGSLSAMRMEASDGSLFDLSSFDFTSGYLDGSRQAAQLAVTGYNEHGIAVATSLFSGNSYNHLSFATLNLSGDFQGLSSVTFEATGLENRTGYDNFVVNDRPASVPEPATMFLLGTGLAGLVGIRRKKKQQQL